MSRARLKAPTETPAAYDPCLSRVVDRRIILGKMEKQHYIPTVTFGSRNLQTIHHARSKSL